MQKMSEIFVNIFTWFDRSRRALQNGSFYKFFKVSFEAKNYKELQKKLIFSVFSDDKKIIHFSPRTNGKANFLFEKMV